MMAISGAENTWVGLDNYTRALGDPQFRLSVVNAVVYMLVTVPGETTNRPAISPVDASAFPSWAQVR